jgi:hypothetical protein
MIRMPKTLSVAVAAAALFGAAAFAQDGAATPPAAPEAPAAPAAPAAPVFTTACPTLPPVPAMPDGATSRERDMQAAEVAIQAWNADYVNTMNTCRQAEVNAALAEREAAFAAARAAEARYQAAVGQYRADSQVAIDAGARWMAQVDAFNAANTRPRR